VLSKLTNKDINRNIHVYVNKFTTSEKTTVHNLVNTTVYNWIKTTVHNLVNTTVYNWIKTTVYNLIKIAVYNWNENNSYYFIKNYNLQIIKKQKVTTKRKQ
jgi:hypothetical protein